MSCYLGADPSEKDLPLWAHVPVKTLFGYVAFATLVVLWCGLRLASRCVVSGVSWEGFPCRPISALPVTGPRLSAMSHKTICGWLMPVLDLEACRGSLAVN